MAENANVAVKQDDHYGLKFRAPDLFSNDSLMPHQYFETYRAKVLKEPEKILMLALLADAIVCYQGNLGVQDKRKKSLFADAEEWILEKRSDYIFSFANICDVLGFNAEYLREGLIRWKQRVLSTQPITQ